VRPCKSVTIDDDWINNQKWSRDAFGQIYLADAVDGFCIQSTGRNLYLGNCQATDDDAINSNTKFVFNDEEGTIGQDKNFNTFYVGFDDSRRFSRLRLFKKGSFNNSLNKWQAEYGYFGP